MERDTEDGCSCGDPNRPNINHRKRIPCWTYVGHTRYDICPACGLVACDSRCPRAYGEPRPSDLMAALQDSLGMHPVRQRGGQVTAEYEDDDYDDIDLLIDTDPIALGIRCRQAEAQVRSLHALLEAECWTHHSSEGPHGIRYKPSPCQIAQRRAQSDSPADSGGVR